LVNLLCQRVLRLNDQVPFMVHFTSRVAGDVSIGPDVWKSLALSGGCYLQGINGIRIGGGTLIAPGVKIISADHDLEHGGWLPAPPIEIGTDCWIGANAVILPGVTLGDGVIVGAGAVVTRSFDDGVRVVGVPARAVPSSRPIVIASPPAAEAGEALERQVGDR
jgi:carbonic anhydrase/acetyltransferase-like protein (isoleucine patch superfamily)